MPVGDVSFLRKAQGTLELEEPHAGRPSLSKRKLCILSTVPELSTFPGYCSLGVANCPVCVPVDVLERQPPRGFTPKDSMGSGENRKKGRGRCIVAKCPADVGEAI